MGASGQLRATAALSTGKNIMYILNGPQCWSECSGEEIKPAFARNRTPDFPFRSPVNVVTKFSQMCEEP
jgi:hypothetical protein